MGRRIDVEKKRPARWPWVAGLIILALVFWGVTALSRAPEEEEVVPTGITTPDTLPPALIPSRSANVGSTQETNAGSELGALDEQDIGDTARVEGEVVATGNDSFWILAGSHVLRVDSDRRARKGDTLAIEGIIRSADATMTDRMASQVLSRNAEFESWTVLRSLKLVEETAPTDGEAQGESG